MPSGERPRGHPPRPGTARPEAGTPAIAWDSGVFPFGPVWTILLGEMAVWGTRPAYRV